MARHPRQLHTVVAEHGWRLNGQPATYEQIHLAMLAGLLGNIGPEAWVTTTRTGTSARAASSSGATPAHLSKKPGRWIVGAELVETTRLFGRGLAKHRAELDGKLSGPPAEDQLLDPHWEKKAARWWRWSAPRSTASWSTAAGA